MSDKDILLSAALEETQRELKLPLNKEKLHEDMSMFKTTRDIGEAISQKEVSNVEVSTTPVMEPINYMIYVGKVEKIVPAALKALNYILDRDSKDSRLVAVYMMNNGVIAKLGRGDNLRLYKLLPGLTKTIFGKGSSLYRDFKLGSLENKPMGEGDTSGIVLNL